MKLSSLLLAACTVASAVAVPARAEYCNTTAYYELGYSSKIGYACYEVTRYSLLPLELIAPPNAKQMEIMCTDARCRSMIADMNAAYATECEMPFNMPLRATFLDPVVAACATMTPQPTPPSTTAAPVPTTAAPVPITAAPVPTTGAPVPTTAAPVPTTIAPPAETCSTPAWGSCHPSNGPTCCPSNFYCQPWDTRYHQCMQTPTKCSQQFTGIDFYGDDLATVYGIGPGECCDKCAATAGCKAYTYVNDFVSNNVATPACYLKKGTGVRQPNARAVSGVVN